MLQDKGNYYDCIQRLWNILKASKDTNFIIKGRMYKIEKQKLYKYWGYKWLLCPLTSISREKIFDFEEDLKKVLGVIEK